VILPRAVAALAHVVSINELWLSRVVGGEVASAWPDWSVNLAANRLAVAFEKWSSILRGVGTGEERARTALARTLRFAIDEQAENHRCAAPTVRTACASSH
jgi:hypothetical protein